METIHALATLLPLALTSELNLYATVLTVGLSLRFGWVQGAPPVLDLLASWPIIIVAGILFAFEALADKIPVVTQAWDILHTLIRPLGAAMLGFILLNGTADPLVVVLTVLAVGSVTLVTHGGKAGGRLAVDFVIPGGNLVMSTLEDIFAGGLTFFAMQHPYLASGVAALVFLAIVILAPQLFRWSWFTTTSLFAWFRSLFAKVTQSESLPAEYWQATGHKMPELAIQCKAQNVKGANGRSGYLLKQGARLIFTYKAWFSTRVWNLNTCQIFAGQLRQRMLVDVLEIHYRDSQQKKRVARFMFQRDRKPLVDGLMSLLRSRA